MVDDNRRECDVALFFYDQSNAKTFMEIMPLFTRFCRKKIPCLVVACKADLPADPSLKLRPYEELRKYGLLPVSHCNIGRQTNKLPLLAIEQAILCKSPLPPSPTWQTYLRKASWTFVGVGLLYVAFVTGRHFYRHGSFRTLSFRHFNPRTVLTYTPPNRNLSYRMYA